MAIIDFNRDDSSLVLHKAPPKEMLSIRKESGRVIVRINSSSLSIIQECLRKAKYYLLDGWKSENESPATLFGSAIHKALEVYYSGAPEERILPRLEDLEPIAFGHAPKTDGLIERSIAAFVEKAQALKDLPDTDKRSLINGTWILHEYFKAFINDPYITHVDDDGPFVERTFDHVIHEDQDCTIILFGTIDFAWRHIQTGEVVCGDHKTASFLNFGGASYFDRDKPNHQYTGYVMGAKKVFGIPSDNFIVNVLEVKAKPKTKGAKGVSFPRQPTKRTEEDFAELKEVLLDSVQRYMMAETKNSWPMGPVDACNKYGGCPYKQVCASPNSLRETILRNKFIKEGQS